MYKQKRIYRENGLAALKQAAIPLLFTAAVLALVLVGLGETERSSREEGKRVLEEGLWRAAVTCYAVEGRYPPTLDHITDFYGVHIDKRYYSVFYEISASNLAPVITVIETQGGG